MLSLTQSAFESCTSSRSLAPAILLEISDHFNSIVLTHDQWNNLVQEVSDEFSFPWSIRKPGSDFKMEMILDCSTIMENEQTISEWKPVVNITTEIEHTTDLEDMVKAALPTILSSSGGLSDLLKIGTSILLPMFSKNLPAVTGYNLSHVRKSVLKALVFKVIPGKNKYRLKVDTAFARKMSKNYIVGCNVSISDNPSFGDIAQICKNINATMYILHSKIELDSDKLKNSHYYANNVRSKLEEAKGFRKEILKLHPTANVMLHVDVSSNFLQAQNNTLFCNPAVYQVNEYYEAILNWGNLSHFPLIMKTATDSLANQGPPATSWLTHLQPFDRENMMVTDLPSFVLRNYPEKVNNWEVDPCLDWTFGRPDDIRNINYFHNDILGGIMRTGKSQGGQQLYEVKELEMMLQFNFHKFQMTEVVVENSSSNIVAALKNQDMKQLTEQGKRIFISCTFTSTNGVMEFVLLIKDMQYKHMKFIAGVHIDFWSMIMIVQAFAGQKKDNLLNVLETMSGSLVAGSNFNLGLEMSLENCLFAYSGLRTEFILSILAKFDFFQRFNYFVCIQKVRLTQQDDMKALGHVFDAHLYTKRGFQTVLPHVNLYFRVEIEVVLNEDSVIMDRYFRLLSHFKSFGKAYNINYFIVEAFDGKSAERQNGWWKIKDFKDLTNRESYLEKESVYSGRQMWFPPLPERKETSNHIIAYAAAIVAVIFIIAGIIVIGVCSRYTRLNKYLSDNEVKEFLQGRSLLVGDNENGASAEVEDMKFNSDYELSILDISIDTQKVVGFGNFGTVYKGIAKGKEAAIKKPNRDCAKTVFKSFLCEIKVFCHIGPHPNVVCFIGAYIKEIHKGVLCIATEFCTNGSLESYLKQLKRDVYQDMGELPEQESFPNVYDLHRFSREIAEGMEYIGSRKVVHGDLSTRNVLLNENKTCKIGDFGLSRKLHEYEEYVKKSENDAMPWKWMAYETLTERVFTLKSDVWSYGVTLWEVYSLGSTPYGGLSWTPQFVDELKNGLRLSSPGLSADIIYKRMEECWNINAEQRPIFADLADFFRSLGRDEYSIV